MRTVGSQSKHSVVVGHGAIQIAQGLASESAFGDDRGPLRLQGDGLVELDNGLGVILLGDHGSGVRHQMFLGAACRLVERVNWRRRGLAWTNDDHASEKTCRQRVSDHRKSACH